MRALAVISVAFAGMASGQIRPIDWPLYGGDAQRTGWEKGDSRITKENVKDFQLVLKRKLDTKSKGPFSLTPPVIIGRLISYRGFKELAFVAGAFDNLWSIDADTDRMFWQKHLDASKAAKSSCTGNAGATPALVPPVNFAGGRPPRGAARPAAPAGPRGLLGGGGFGAARPIFALASDGKLHVLNTSTGDDQSPAMNFLPASAKASSLTISDGAIYTTTSGGCGGAPDGVWAIDLSTPEPKVASYNSDGGPSGLGGLAIGADGTVYVQTANKLLALTSKDLKLKQSFDLSSSGTTPVVFPFKGRDLIISAGKGGRLYLMDSQSLTALHQTEPLSAGEIWGGLSSWQDDDGTRWVLAPVWGPAGAIVAFKVEESNGKPALTQAWVSRNMSSPEPPVITNGVVFALSAGESTHATLYALDAATGKEMYSTGDQVTAPGNLTGITLANGRVYFTTNDGTLYAFGIFLER
jgi:outer membrane protein assembly factor BamB